MGDIADAILEGELCQYCGEHTGISPGYPVSCSGCEPTKRQRNYNKPKSKTVPVAPEHQCAVIVNPVWHIHLRDKPAPYQCKKAGIKETADGVRMCQHHFNKHQNKQNKKQC